MEVYTWRPDYSYIEDIEFATEITKFRGTVEQRRARRSVGIRTFSLNYKLLDQSEIDEIWAFYIARNGIFEAFLYRNYPNDYQITNETLGYSPGDSTNVDFYFNYYPVQPSVVTLNPPAVAPKIYVATVLQTSGYTIDTDNRKVTFSSAPTGAITADYEYYRRVRFVQPYITRELFSYDSYNMGIKLKELVL